MIKTKYKYDLKLFIRPTLLKIRRRINVYIIQNDVLALKIHSTRFIRRVQFCIIIPRTIRTWFVYYGFVSIWQMNIEWQAFSIIIDE